MLKKICATVLVAMFGGVALDSAPRPEKFIPNTVETIIDDMSLPHEGAPHGVPPNYTWAHKPVVQAGNDTEGFRAMTPWGQVFEDAEGSPAVNARVEVRDLRAYILSRRDGQWRLVSATRAPQGHYFVENFIENAHKTADVRPEADGGVSAKPGGGYNFHFWADRRIAIDPSDIAGVFVTCRARLVVDKASLPDDRATARFLFSVGGDYWVNLTAPWDHFKTNKGIAIGRFRRVTPEWRSYNMSTLTPEVLRRMPPPLD